MALLLLYSFILVHVDTSLSLKCQPITCLVSSHELVVSTFVNGRMLARGGAVVGAGVAGYAGGRALGRSTPYPGGGTIDENVQEAVFLPFWDWWYGNTDSCAR